MSLKDRLVDLGINWPRLMSWRDAIRPHAATRTLNDQREVVKEMPLQQRKKPDKNDSQSRDNGRNHSGDISKNARSAPG
jgi:hypothetical protein